MSVATERRAGGGLRAAAVGACCGLVGLAGGFLLGPLVREPSSTQGYPLAAATADGASAERAANAGAADNKGGPAAGHAGLGVSLERFKDALDSPSVPRFTYHNGGSAGEQPLSTGILGDNLAVIEVAGPPDNLSRATLTLQLTGQAAEPVVQSAEYLVLFASAVSPGWEQAGKWIKDALPATAGGKVAATTRDNVRISLSRIDRFGLVQMIAEAP